MWYYSNNRENNSRRFEKVVQKQCVEESVISDKKTTICNRVDKEVKLDVGYWDKFINSLPSTNKQTN